MLCLDKQSSNRGTYRSYRALFRGVEVSGFSTTVGAMKTGFGLGESVTEMMMIRVDKYREGGASSSRSSFG